jgi:thiamine pyrophosphokinase
MVRVMNVVIVANGEVDDEALRRVRGDPETGRASDGERALVICADGGAMRATAVGLVPDVVIGDGDSLTGTEVDALRRQGVPVRIVPAAKDQSDTELCLLEAIDRGARRIVLYGALGGRRLEHGLANIGLLALPQLAGVTAVIEHGPSRLQLIGEPNGPTSLELEGSIGDFVSLLPFGGEADGVTTEGLRYPLRDEPLPLGPARGLSNELSGTRAAVRVRRGRLLVIQTRRADSDGPLE